MEKGKTMTDYIKREDAMKLLDMLLEHYHDTGIEVIKHTAAIAPKEFHISEEDDIADFNFEIDAWKKDFSAIPSVDVAPVRHGRWIDKCDGAECSICGSFWEYAGVLDKNGIARIFRYCETCGARMDGEIL